MSYFIKSFSPSFNESFTAVLYPLFPSFLPLLSSFPFPLPFLYFFPIPSLSLSVLLSDRRQQLRLIIPPCSSKNPRPACHTKPMQPELLCVCLCASVCMCARTRVCVPFDLQVHTQINALGRPLMFCVFVCAYVRSAPLFHSPSRAATCA